MIKRKVRVTIEKDIEIHLHPAYDDPEFVANEIKEFSETFHRVDSIDDIILYAAENIARFGTEYFIEGIGRVVEIYDINKLDQRHDYSNTAAVRMEDTDIQSEFI
jgi:hypothetical protein